MLLEHARYQAGHFAGIGPAQVGRRSEGVAAKRGRQAGAEGRQGRERLARAGGASDWSDGASAAWRGGHPPAHQKRGGGGLIITPPDYFFLWGVGFGSSSC